jgi:Uma2 family endonuclease
MTAVTALPWGRPLRRADLAAMPDDGHRYELIDGVLVVTPAPAHRHQRAVLRLALSLDAACPADCEVIVAPFDVVLADDTLLQPDILVGRLADITPRDLPVAPLLAVEVLAPSTRRVDLMLKRSRFEAAGVGSFWVIDPDEPALRAWDLVNGRYVEVADVSGDDSVELRQPFPVVIQPAALVSRPR